MKRYLIYIFLIVFLSGCTVPIVPNPDEAEHNCSDFKSEWENVGEVVCGVHTKQQITCTKCGEILETQTIPNPHNYQEEVIQEQDCVTNGITKYTCSLCGDSYNFETYPTGHVLDSLVEDILPTDEQIGQRHTTCSVCHGTIRTYNYVNNGYNFNGKLSVNGRDLVNQDGEKIQLFGLSTHGIQWFGRYLNFETIAAIQSEFGINIIRFALYTDESGFCSGNSLVKEQMLKDLHEGIDAATKLGLYVIVDWHMVGATNPLDKNPLTYLEESKEFFSYISEYYKDQNNILYEIMNEPNGKTTWADCKKYAEAVIPCIRKNTDAIILVGNPRWTADLTSVMNDPLVGYSNIMYTYHFYAKDHSRTSQVEKAYDAGFPVFISEFGFMNSDGDGKISTTNGEKWKKVLDERNISYVAWNISNSGGSASIFKQNSPWMDDVSDSNLKEWGIYLKNWYREKAGLD